ncbi:hypothetical protein QTG56_25415 (plasmid) [Rossellomorea sp. AcN35-11]|nr:hypothetical protein [Rossellomorea aquimaris]WJV31956.1 hypothetical protein QTG56_25415 [Rossellomorea sp. AcN35-11]
MEHLHVKGIGFGSYLKLMLILSLSVGLVLGAILFILSIFNGDVYAYIGPIQLTGVLAGIFSIFLSPLIFGIWGLIIGLVSFLPVKLTLKVIKGIKMNLNLVQGDINTND